MTRLLYTSYFLVLFTYAAAQDPDDLRSAAQLETLAVNTDQETENDQLVQFLQYLLRRPLPINRVGADHLLDLHLLTPQQLNSFVQYRELFGPFRSKYELQAIPFWDLETIRKILPYLSFTETGEVNKLTSKVISKGQHQVILRSSNTLEKAMGFESDSNGVRKYAGSPVRLFYRYTFQYKQQLWWGFTGDKDAGEQVGDFTSFHLFIRRKGLLKTLALGDFVLNIGQGLVHWQGLAFGKTSEVMGVYHQGNLLQPYRSGGEWNFHRGIAAQLQKEHWELTVFGSARKLTANTIRNGTLQEGFSSISENGYHRTKGELADRNSLLQKSYGAVLQYLTGRFRAGVSAVAYNFSLPSLPEDKPYNRYAIRGRNWYNSGIHYTYTYRNIFLFGEGAVCKNGFGILQGMVMSIHHKVDLSIVYRNIQPGYQSLYGKSFTENSSVTNETGWYTALRLVPWPGWQVQAYADYFRFPWLRFKADSPGSGQEYFLQVGWIKRKKWDIYLRYRSTGKQENISGNYLNEPVPKLQANLRWHAERIVNQRLELSSRLDQVWYSRAGEQQSGTSVFVDGRYQLPKPTLVVSARIQYFKTGGYDSRIYSYERDLLYSFSIPAFYDKGFRYYCQVQGKPARIGRRLHVKLQWWLRWSQTKFGESHTIGSGGDEIRGNKKSEWKFQIMMTW
ncbi:helix-hairpin-helix domain-containing protein [Flavihumibacter fluvii]|uniref:helix-hairpin-helix domain-containing protein n=1 Tax=Flavihumibacter fluvii TaxID=2838157 RepID=UPI001BDF543B|nr:helix-hairpin-helix domain-containing protein [Flavihumibacter fluvii]ULQ53031.1 helix-hairpin-helix domain-containing protein [Flavihumibacter fluvii]